MPEPNDCACHVCATLRTLAAEHGEESKALMRALILERYRPPTQQIRARRMAGLEPTQRDPDHR